LQATAEEAALLSTVLMMLSLPLCLLAFVVHSGKVS